MEKSLVRLGILCLLPLFACTPSRPAPVSTSDSALVPVHAAPSTPRSSATPPPSVPLPPGTSPKPSAGPCTSPDVASPARRATSPDGRVTVFVSVDASRIDATSIEDLPHEDLCIARDGGPPRVLVAGRSAGPNEGVEKTLAAFGGLVFSPDSNLLFFSSAAWVTSSAAHVVDIASGNERFLFDGAVISSIVQGRDRGAYLAWHFRLDQEHPISSPKYRGRMESWSIVSKEGKLLRKASEKEAKELGASSRLP